MKSIKFISMMMGCLAALCVTFTSCDDDDDNQPLTPQEQKTAFEAVKGTHSGSVIFPASNPKNSKDVADTVAVSWNILSDSTMTISNFPVAKLGVNVSDTAVSKAILAQNPQDIKCAIKFTRTSPVTFIINPTAVSLTLEYGGKSHNVQIPFLTNSNLSFGSVVSNGKGAIQMQLIEGAILEDGKATTWLKQGVPFVFISTTTNTKK